MQTHTKEVQNMTSNPINTDRRQDPRYSIRARAHLACVKGEWEVHLLDMSLSGAKFALLDEHALEADDIVALSIDTTEFHLPDSTHKKIHLRGTLVHSRQHMLGVEYKPFSEIDKQLLILLLKNNGKEV